MKSIQNSITDRFIQSFAPWPLQSLPYYYDFCWLLTIRCYCCIASETSRDKVISLSSHISATFTYNSPIPQPLMTSCCFAHSSLLYAWCDSCSSDQDFASIFFQIPSHDRHPWYWLVVGSCDIAPTVDFHHLDICHARHTKKVSECQMASEIFFIIVQILLIF